MSSARRGYGFPAGSYCKPVGRIPLTRSGLPLYDVYTPGERGLGAMDNSGAYLEFWPTPLAFDEPAVLPGVEIAIRFSKRGLKLDTVVTSKFVGSADARCRAAPRIRFRVRIAESHGRPTSAQLVAVADDVSKPLLYVEWTPTTGVHGLA